jgi:5-methyltetrahydrofolate--homocysteine methyltransferase
MAIAGLTIIGESINDSVPSTSKLFTANDIEGLKELARFQDERGAGYIDVNVGQRSPEFLAEMVRQVQSVTEKPLSIDTPDVDMAEAGLRAYDVDRARGRMPILNSISVLRTGMFALRKIMPFMPILMASEREVNGVGKPNHTGEEVHQTAVDLVKMAHEHGIKTDECIIDPAIAPIGADTEGQTLRVVKAMQLIHADPFLKGVHASVGLSNFTVMIPPRRSNGELVKTPLESAFLTMTVPLGMDHVIASVKKNYQVLPPDHDAMMCLNDVLELDGLDILMRVQEFYS